MLYSTCMKKYISRLILSIVTSVGILSAVVSAQSLTIADSNAGVGNFCTYVNRAIPYGERSDLVSHLQTLLRSQYSYNVSSTGYFGPVTFNLVKQLQRNLRINYPSGSLGPITLARLRAVWCTDSQYYQNNQNKNPDLYVVSYTGPTTVTISVATCATGSGKVEWGDNSAETQIFDYNNFSDCQQNVKVPGKRFEMTHTYQNAGSYTIKVQSYAGQVVDTKTISLPVYNQQTINTNQNYSEYDKFAMCIKNSGAKLYCTSWAPHCQNQKNLFNTSAQYLPYVECSDASGQNQTQICKNNNVNAYPTWDFYVNGFQNRTTGQKTLQELAQATNCPLPVTITTTNQNSLDVNYSYSKSGYKSWTLNESGVYGEGTNLNLVSGSIGKEVSVIYNQDGQQKFNVTTTYTNNSNIQSQINTCYEKVYLPSVNKQYYYAYSTGFFYDERPTDICIANGLSARKINPGEKVTVTGRFNISQNMMNIANVWGLSNIEIGEANYDKIIMSTQDR